MKHSHDTKKIDEVVMALLYLNLHEGNRAWKSFDWNAMDRLYENGWISNPRSKAKSVVLTEEGLSQAAALFKKHFVKNDEP